MLVAVFFGVGLTGAMAQDQAEPTALEQVETQAPDATQAPQNAVRFVSQPMVQDIPAPELVDSPTALEASSLRELVAKTPVSNAMSREMECLAEAVYFESRGEPLAGQLAVAQVIINRAESNLFPDDYCSVVTQRAQFSFVRGGHIPTPNTSSLAWERARAIARIAHQELWDSEADDALYFHAAHVSPRWARNKSTRARIDSHIFYR
ncbi:hypothetical protein GCM10009127_01550 [Alteraurantiacibacter aestuarii]|nr:cell wall hydrolase [Alteraurantiacibacter aestuarii]